MRQYLRRRRHGQALVVIAFSITALLAFTALVLNFGFFLVERRQLQNAADAAAMAAVWRLLDQHTSRSLLDVPVAQSADQIARLNGVDVGGSRQLQAYYLDAGGTQLGAVGAGGQFPTSAAGVGVSLSGEFTTLLSPFAGQAGIQARAEAQAHLMRVAFPSTLVNPVPLAVPLAAFDAGASFDLYDQQVANLAYGVTGYLPFLDLRSAAGAQDYGDLHTNLQYWSDGSHNSGTLGIGTQVALTGGGYKPDVRTGLLDNVRRAGLVDGNGDAFVLIAVPLWDTYIPAPAPGDPDMVQIVGFATFKLLERDIGAGALPGFFVPYVADPSSATRVTGPFWGPSVVALTQ